MTKEEQDAKDQAAHDDCWEKTCSLIEELIEKYEDPLTLAIIFSNHLGMLSYEAGMDLEDATEMATDLIESTFTDMAADDEPGPGGIN